MSNTIKTDAGNIILCLYFLQMFSHFKILLFELLLALVKKNQSCKFFNVTRQSNPVYPG